MIYESKENYFLSKQGIDKSIIINRLHLEDESKIFLNYVLDKSVYMKHILISPIYL
jgi:hypothetical protein